MEVKFDSKNQWRVISDQSSEKVAPIVIA